MHSLISSTAFAFSLISIYLLGNLPPTKKSALMSVYLMIIRISKIRHNYLLHISMMLLVCIGCSDTLVVESSDKLGESYESTHRRHLCHEKSPLIVLLTPETLQNQQSLIRIKIRPHLQRIALVTLSIPTIHL